MFEKELYDHEASQIKAKPGDLFYNYEIKNWNWTPRLYQILAVSAIVNILGLFVIAQTNLLTMRGCQSPFVGRVCEVLDTVYVSAMVFGTERDYVDAVYEKTELADADITYIDVSNVSPPLSYPEGYFQIANPEQYAAMQRGFGVESANNGFTFPSTPPITSVPTPGNDLINTPPITPRTNPNAVKGDLPDSPFSMDDSNTAVGANRKGRRLPPGKANANTEGHVAEANTNTENKPTVDPTNPVDPEDINKRPFKDLGNFVNELLDKKQVSLDSAFLLKASGKLNKDGKLDSKTFKFSEVTSPDPKMVEVLKESIEAINDSGYLKYLKDLSGKNLELVVQQNDQILSAVVQSELESDTRARVIRSGLITLISIKKNEKGTADADQNDKDDLLLLSNARVETEGKKIVISFELPKAVVLQMIQRKLAEQKLEKDKPSGTASLKSDDDSAK